MEGMLSGRKKKTVRADQFPAHFLDIPYAEESETQKLDIYLPEGKGPFPTVVQIHGGAWLADSKRCEDTASIFKMVSQGYAMVAVDYRLSGEAQWPAHFLDVQAAVGFIKKHGAEYGLNTEKLVVWGNSAGGHLAQMLAAKGWESQGESGRIDGLISWYGLGNLTVENHFDGERKHPIELLMGKSFEEDPQSYLDASPYKYVDKNFPPALFQHGIEDKLVNWKQSEEMFRRVTEICGTGRAKLELFPGGHGSPAIKCDANVRRCIQFLDEIYGIKRNYLEMKLPEILLEG